MCDHIDVGELRRNREITNAAAAAAAGGKAEERLRATTAKLAVDPASESMLTDFGALFNAVCKEVNRLAHEKGFWEWNEKPDTDPQLDPVIMASKLALIHSEISEALECVRERTPQKQSAKVPTLTNMEEELADAVIRIMDLAYEYGYNLGGAIVLKHLYNTKRPHKHGKTC